MSPQDRETNPLSEYGPAGAGVRRRIGASMDRTSEKTLDGFSITVAKGGTVGPASAAVLIEETRRLRSLLSEFIPSWRRRRAKNRSMQELELR